MRTLTDSEKAAVEAQREIAWFAVKIALGMLAVSYVLGTPIAIAFLAGWLWGTRTKAEPPDVHLEDLL
jgi:ABC-type spermidine/putrescine transport system permease subunit II